MDIEMSGSLNLEGNPEEEVRYFINIAQTSNQVTENYGGVDQNNPPKYNWNSQLQKPWEAIFLDNYLGNFLGNLTISFGNFQGNLLKVHISYTIS